MNHPLIDNGATSVTVSIPGQCWHCGGTHPEQQCRRISAIEYHGDGSVKRIEYNNDFP